MSGTFAHGVMCDESLRDSRRNKLMSAAPRASGGWPTEVVESRRIISCGELAAD